MGQLADELVVVERVAGLVLEVTARVAERGHRVRRDLEPDDVAARRRIRRIAGAVAGPAARDEVLDLAHGAAARRRQPVAVRLGHRDPGDLAHRRPGQLARGERLVEPR